MIKIRKVQESDRERYLQMAHDFYHSSAVLHPIPDSFIEKTFDECMKEDAYAIAYLLEYDGETAGYGLLAKTFSQEAGGFVFWIEELYVLEKFRSKGLGGKFFQMLEEERSPEVVRFRLEVEDDNERAIALYRRLGYEELKYSQMVKDFAESDEPVI